MKTYNANQTLAINTTGNLVVMASAGSGKTSVIIARTNNLISQGVDPSSILLITFSKKAKETLISRLKNDSVNIETFHSLALKIIQDKYPGKYQIWTKDYEKEKVVQDILKELGIFDQHEPNSHLKDIFAFIAAQKHKMLYPMDALNYKGFCELSKSHYKHIYTRYEVFKDKNNLIEFDDFLNIAYNIINTDKRMLIKYSSQYKYIMADEFQDVNMNQALLLQKLNADNTMIVGDPLQAIYAFRGGDSRYLLDFDNDYSDVTVVNLDTNYRCKDSIVRASNEFAAKYIPDTKHRNYVESTANRGGGFEPIITGFSNDREEGNYIAKSILDSKKKFGDIAVLSRTNAQLQSVQNALTMHGIPYEVVGGCGYTEQAEIKLLLSYLRLANDTEDNEAFKNLYNKPNRWLGKQFLEEVHANCYGCSYYDSMNTIARRNWKFKNGINEIISITTSLQREKFNNVGDMIAFLRDSLPIDDFFNKTNSDGEYNEKIESMDTFQKMCSRFKKIDDLLLFLKNISSSNNADSVKLLTIHKSKGLEFPVVYLMGLDSKHMPHYMNDNIEDEARIMYVGMTRAADELYMSYAGEPGIFIPAVS